MHFGIVGGLDRAEPRFHRAARAAGHEVTFHTGRMHGRGKQSLEWMAEHCDVIVIVTEVNSHGAVQFMRRLLRQHGREAVLVRKCGTGRFEALLQQLAQPVAA